MFKKIFILFILIQFSYGCWNPFETRKAEKPSDSDTMWDQPEKPTIVISNFQKSYQNRNLAFYIENFSEDFEFIADPHEKNGPNSNLYENWDKSAEESVTSLIFERYANEFISLTFINLPDEPDPVAPTGSATLYRKYTLSITNSEYTPPESPAEGIAIFEMTENTNGYWTISRWTDQRQETADWGEFKANFR